MSMELLAVPYLTRDKGGFYEPHEARDTSVAPADLFLRSVGFEEIYDWGYFAG